MTADRRSPANRVAILLFSFAAPRCPGALLILQAMATTVPAFLLLLLACSSAAHAFDLLGVAPVDFRKKDLLAVKVSPLSSIKTQLSYSYYTLPFCRPPTVTNSANLGEVLRGGRIEDSLYEFKMMEPKHCQIVCKIVLSQEEAKDFMEKIEDEYLVNMILDDLPMVRPIMRLSGDGPPFYQQGVHVGVMGQYSGSHDKIYFIYNHFSFLVKYNKVEHTDLARIVGFELTPRSVKHEFDGEWRGNATHLKICDPQTRRFGVHTSGPQKIEADKEIIFTYDINFEESDINWASRWDTYNLVTDYHWFSVVNSLMMVLFLSGTIAMILLRILYRDISKYNQLLESQEVNPEETGWKLLHGDVFRPPANADLLCVYAGTGVQLFGMVLVTLLFAVLGLVSSLNRGGLITIMLLLWVLMGLLAGYFTARLYKMFRGLDSEWKKITIKTAVMFPGVVFVTFFVLNALVWSEKSCAAPLASMLALVLLWFGVSVPLVCIGSYLGFKKPAMEDPVRTNKIPRPIPERAWYMNPVISVLIGGVLPFGAVLMEFFFILTAMWLHQFYYIFGFLFLIFMVLILTCASIAILLCYFQLCGEDYHWWWRSYLTSGSSALYLFLYATFYFFTKLEVTKAASIVLYFGYMLIASYAFFVLTGTIGFCACLWFTRLIYSSLKID